MRKPRNKGTNAERPSLFSPDPEICLAKTWKDREGNLLPGRSVYEHCLIVGAVARELIAGFPPQLRDTLFPAGSALLAACHDIGKLSPTFYLRLFFALKQPLTAVQLSLLTALGLEHHATAVRDHELRWSGHAGVSAVALQAITHNSHLSAIVGQHHGCRATGILGATAVKEDFGGESWQQARERLVAALQKEFGAAWPEALSPGQRLLLAGLTSVADWIGSGPCFDDPALNWRGALTDALVNAGQIPPQCVPDLAFGDIFHDADGTPYQPNEAQRQLFEAVTGPGVYVLEAPMGMGKTEAALYAAYKMLATGEARGIYFALPTQLTSDKIYARFVDYLHSILMPDSPHQQALRLHGKAHLHQEMGEEGKPGGSWFASRKRGLLAPFAVGTLDQALMAAMNVKHGFVRTFGLAGKVVVLDEIHSYEAYTGTIVQKLVDVLRDLHCTVIILSATLTQSRRNRLLNANDSDKDTQAYPLISAQPGHSTGVVMHPLTPPPSRQVALRYASDSAALDEALMRAEQGQQVLWIENSVSGAQDIYSRLAARCREMGLECGLLHSRFTLRDRDHNETLWVALYGKNGWPTRTTAGRVLIGTQVLEQSIDIDADFLISRFAPTDMLMQRLGRLWRHEHTPRPQDARCEAWILAPDLASAIANPYAAFQASALVYAPYVLCRSLDVWRERETVAIPADIRLMLEATYAEREEQGAMSRWKQELFDGKKSHPVRKGVRELEQRARLTLSGDAQTLPESDAQTRYSEQETRSFLLLTSVRYDEQAKTTRLTLRGGDELHLPWSRSQLDEATWRKHALQLEKECVALRKYQLPAGEETGIWQRGLQHVFYPGNSREQEQEAPDVMVAIIDASGDLRGVNGEFRSTAYRYRYRDDTGLQVTKKE